MTKKYPLRNEKNRQKRLSLIYLQFCEYFLLVQANEVNFLAVSLQRCQGSEGKLNSCKPSKERVRTCKDYVIGREISPKATVIICILCAIL